MHNILKYAAGVSILTLVTGCDVFEDIVTGFGESRGEFDDGPLFVMDEGWRHFNLSVLTPDGKVAFIDERTFAPGDTVNEDAISPGRTHLYIEEFSTFSGLKRVDLMKTDDIQTDRMLFSYGRNSEVSGLVRLHTCDVSTLEALVVERVENDLRDRVGVDGVPYEIESVSPLVYSNLDDTIEGPETLEDATPNWEGWLSDNEAVAAISVGISFRYTYSRDVPAVRLNLLDPNVYFVTARYTEDEGWAMVDCSLQRPSIPPISSEPSRLGLDGRQLQIDGAPALVARSEVVYRNNIEAVSREIP